jgi:hypothetical protein
LNDELIRFPFWSKNRTQTSPTASSCMSTACWPGSSAFPLRCSRSEGSVALIGVGRIGEQGASHYGRPCRVGGSAELAEEFPHVADQEIGCFHRGEMAAAAELGPMHYVMVALGEGPDGGVAGKHRHRGRYR